MKKLSPRIFDWLALLAIVAAVTVTLLGSEQSTEQPEPTISTSVRTEIQRYMGYEDLPVRYLSLPYDSVMNRNEQLALLDIGFLMLAFVPMILIFAFRDSIKLQWTTLLACIILLTISTATGYILGTNFEQFRITDGGLANYLSTTSFSDAPTGVFAAMIYQGFGSLYQVLESSLGQIHGGAMAYPILLASLAFTLFLASEVVKGQTKQLKALVFFLVIYTFFWLILSSGIMWYGFLVIPLLTALVFFGMKKQGMGNSTVSKIGRYGFLALVGLTLLMGFAQRFSNVQLKLINSDPMAGKRLYDPAYLKYQVGDLKKSEVTEAYYPGLTKALNEINQESKSLIYNVGTRFNFFIENNDKRIFKDNLLDLFETQLAPLLTKTKVNQQLKSWGFKYIMLDLNTPTGDKTPEQTLVQRYKKFTLLLYQNPEIELISTDRIIKSTGGQQQYEYGVFGEAASLGSYAIFRIK